MDAEEHPIQFRPSMRRATRILLKLALVLLAFSAVSAQAGRHGGAESATRYFTEVSQRLLKAELGLNPARISIFPTNQYDGAVHRLLQLSANLYDATTNRSDLTDYPYVPTVFRPLFRRDAATNIFIVGYREVNNAALAESNITFVDLDIPVERGTVPLFGQAFNADDRNEPMVWGIPLVLGAKKGFPNFNEFSMQNGIEVGRRLQFRRAPGDLTGPVIETNQMYTVSILNVCGMEAWNSYSNNFPRALRMQAGVDLFVALTNTAGGNSNVLFTNWFRHVGVADLISNSWNGWRNDQFALTPSLRVPLSNAIAVLAPSTWRPLQFPQFSPMTTEFESPSGFPIPRWWLTLKLRVHFSLVDISVEPNRIVDYVSLTKSDDALDVASALLMWAGGMGSQDSVDPAGLGNPWATNRFLTADQMDESRPTVGILNQMISSQSRVGPSGLPRYVLDPAAGPSAHYAVDSFRNQLAPDGYQLRTIFAENAGKQFYKSNVFHAPLVPVGTIYKHLRLQANDPLVHTILPDLGCGLQRTNITVYSPQPPLENLGRVNPCYEPWLDGLLPINPARDYWLSQDGTGIAFKDPLIRQSDDWEFPSSKIPSLHWLGGVHRGTPWQTVYLKSAVAAPDAWSAWLGAHGDPVVRRMHPTNDWRLAADLAYAWSTNRFRSLLPINTPDPRSWREALDGILVLTNLSSYSELINGLPARFEERVMTSESPQAASIADALERARGGFPGGYFRAVSDLLSVPELSVETPWLNREADGLWPDQEGIRGINDEAYEAIPRQLLSRVRADSVGAMFEEGDRLCLEFTGYDDQWYVIERSADLVHWRVVRIQRPRDGLMRLQVKPGVAWQRHFYRSRLLQPNVWLRQCLWGWP